MLNVKHNLFKKPSTTEEILVSPSNVAKSNVSNDKSSIAEDTIKPENSHSENIDDVDDHMKFLEYDEITTEKEREILIKLEKELREEQKKLQGEIDSYLLSERREAVDMSDSCNVQPNGEELLQQGREEDMIDSDGVELIDDTNDSELIGLDIGAGMTDSNEVDQKAEFTLTDSCDGEKRPQSRMGFWVDEVSTAVTAYDQKENINTKTENTAINHEINTAKPPAGMQVNALQKFTSTSF